MQQRLDVDAPQFVTRPDEVDQGLSGSEALGEAGFRPRDVVFICGYAEEVIRARHPEFTYVRNARWEHNNILLQIPPNVYHGFKCIGEAEAMMINCCTEVYDHKEPDEYRLPAHSDQVPDDWSRKDG